MRMSYKETLPKLERILAKIESLSSDFTIDRKVYEEAYKERFDNLKDLLSNLHIGDWEVITESIRKVLEVGFTNSDVMHGDYSFVHHEWVDIDEANSGKDLKDLFFKAIVDCIKYNNCIQLDRFEDEVVKTAETLLSKVDDNLYRDIVEIRKINAKEYNELEAKQKELAGNIKEYTDRAQELILQAVTEWFDEGNLTKGSTVFFHDDERPRKVISIDKGKVYAKLIDQRYFSNHDIESMGDFKYQDKVRTWKANNPQLPNIDMLLNPMAFVER